MHALAIWKMKAHLRQKHALDSGQGLDWRLERLLRLFGLDPARGTQLPEPT
jgi:hypothetical protein